MTAPSEQAGSDDQGDEADERGDDDEGERVRGAAEVLGGDDEGGRQ